MGLLVQTAKNYLCTCGSLIRVYYYNYAHGCVFAHALVVFLTSVVWVMNKRIFFGVVNDIRLAKGGVSFFQSVFFFKIFFTSQRLSILSVSLWPFLSPLTTKVLFIVAPVFLPPCLSFSSRCQNMNYSISLCLCLLFNRMSSCRFVFDSFSLFFFNTSWWLLFLLIVCITYNCTI